MQKKGWKLGQTITLAGTIFPGDWPFTIRAVYRAKKKSFGEEAMFFHYDYLSQKGMGGQNPVGTYILELTDPSQAAPSRTPWMRCSRTRPRHAHRDGAGVPGRVREHVRQHPVRTAHHRAGDRVQHPAHRREHDDDLGARAHQRVGVLKTLGFTDGAVFAMVVAEAAIITLGGGLLGALGAKAMVEGRAVFGTFLPRCRCTGAR